ncbi:MAG TPA: YihY/virulence factor BrkB family protein [Candidatus Dormibacteraeota bacterium]
MKALLSRLQKTFVVRLLMAYGNSQASNYASVVAFNAFVTMFPLILGVLAVLGLVLRSHGLEGHVESSIISFFPDQTTQENVLKALRGVKEDAGLLGLASLAGLLWTGTNFFAALEFALDQVYGIKTRSLVPQRLMALGMLLAFVVAMLVSVGASALVAFLPAVPFVGVLVGAGVMIALLLLVYWVVPNREQSWAEVWPGALLAGVLIEILTLVWPLYADLMHGFNTYGQTFGLFFLLATWLYLLSQLILLGAVLNHMRLHGEPVPEPKLPPARAVDEDAERRGVELQQARRPRPQA